MEEEGGGPLIFPRKWMLPHLPESTNLLFKDDLGLFCSRADPAVIRVVMGPATSQEVTLDTSLYRPDELTINVVEGAVATTKGKTKTTTRQVLVVEGRHRAAMGTRVASTVWR